MIILLRVTAVLQNAFKINATSIGASIREKWMASLLGSSGPALFRTRMGHMSVFIIFGKAPFQGSLLCR